MHRRRGSRWPTRSALRWPGKLHNGADHQRRCSLGTPPGSDGFSGLRPADAPEE